MPLGAEGRAKRARIGRLCTIPGAMLDWAGAAVPGRGIRPSFSFLL